ncbi:hypothetical protein C7C46_28370 [Streptomyces tateyamensis]|uniref:Uncharacterized protein n=1 Tax=Streptomyces tateyamensis TaxID=565073 RepID=A0A2V4N6B7_9ACTN|nr:hypothetical protein [Streptomyces tateyamensis]PYC69034.1 hypothetical protein C7C46_28370 [Streptomyces tateyamensis]
MATRENGTDDEPQVDQETREQSAEQRNITAPTPRDVREDGTDEDTEEDEQAPRPPAADTRAP